MSRRGGRHAKKSRGHGILGFIITLIIVVAIVGAIMIFFTGEDMSGLKGTVYGWFYPQKYTEQVEKYSAEFNVDKNLIYAVIRTESGFRAEVESQAGAVGLMQLMPDTFTWLQESLDGEITHTSSDLKDPDVNVRYGTYFLSMLLSDYNGNVRTAAAAYNAGFSNVDEWLNNTAYSPDGKTLTNIPYKETADYADRVTEAYRIYGKLYP